MSYIDESAVVENCILADTANIWKNVFIKNTTLKEHVNIGDFSRIETSNFNEHVGIQRNALIYGTRMGKYTYVGKNFTSWYAEIGKFCSISWNVGIGGADHDYDRITTHAFLYSPYMGLMNSNPSVKPYNRFEKQCVIGNDVWIGANAIICRGVTVGDGAVVGAGSVVTHDIEPYTIVGGVPAKPIKMRFNERIIERLLRIRWWDLDDSVIKENFDLFNSNPNESVLAKLEILSGVR